MSAVNPHTVVVLATGGPVTMPWLGSVAAVVQTYFGGQEQGSALADVLWGDATPQGKLTVTYPTQRAGDAAWPGEPLGRHRQPGHRLQRGRGRRIQGLRRRRHHPACSRSGTGSRTPPSATAGSGSTRRTSTPPGWRRSTCSSVVTNTGRRAGTETAQLYVGLPASTGEPPKRLVGYAQVTLAAGRSAIVHLEIDPAAANHPLSYFDQASHQWRLAGRHYRVYVGTSERDTPLSATFRVG